MKSVLYVITSFGFLAAFAVSMLLFLSAAEAQERGHDDCKAVSVLAEQIVKLRERDVPMYKVIDEISSISSRRDVTDMAIEMVHLIYEPDYGEFLLYKAEYINAAYQGCMDGE